MVIKQNQGGSLPTGILAHVLPEFWLSRAGIFTMHYFSGHDGVFFVSPADVNDYLSIYRPVQLRDSAKTPVNSEYPVMNLGDSKGLTFERVLIYPTSKMTDWIIDHSKELKTKSRSKLYVGVTRAKYSVAIVFDNKKNITVPGINTYTKSVTTQ